MPVSFKRVFRNTPREVVKALSKTMTTANTSTSGYQRHPPTDYEWKTMFPPLPILPFTQSKRRCAQSQKSSKKQKEQQQQQQKKNHCPLAKTEVLRRLHLNDQMLERMLPSVLDLCLFLPPCGFFRLQSERVMVFRQNKQTNRVSS